MTEDPDAETLVQAGVEDWLAEAVVRLARGETESVDTYLHTVGEAVQLPETSTTVRTHFVVTDPAGNPRVDALARKLAKQVIDFCIPRTRINDAHAHLERTGSPEQFVQLGLEAADLFTSLEKSGEGGELLIYFLLEVALKIPQLLCKMVLKTSSEMHVHGVDGIHANLLDDGTLALYWAESKMHSTVTSAMDDCFESISPFLLDPEKAAHRDLLLLRDNLDAGASSITNALVKYFIDDEPQSTKVEIRGACLVGFNYSSHTPFEEGTRVIRKEIATAVDRWHEALASRIVKHKVHAITIEVFCLPVPSVDDFRKAIHSALRSRTV